MNVFRREVMFEVIRWAKGRKDKWGAVRARNLVHEIKLTQLVCCYHSFESWWTWSDFKRRPRSWISIPIQIHIFRELKNRGLRPNSRSRKRRNKQRRWERFQNLQFRSFSRRRANNLSRFRLHSRRFRPRNLILIFNIQFKIMCFSPRANPTRPSPNFLLQIKSISALIDFSLTIILNFQDLLSKLRILNHFLHR